MKVKVEEDDAPHASVHHYVNVAVTLSSISSCSLCVRVYLQYELVAELFQDGAQAVTSPTRRGSGTVPVRPAKELPKSSSQQKQSRKTVGSQARKVVVVIFGWP